MRPLILVALVTSLTTVTTPSSVRAQAGAMRDTTLAYVQVQNNREVPVTVFIDRGEFDVRVGTVQPQQTATLPLPKWITTENSDVRIYLHPEGAEDLETETFAVHPGVHLGLVVPVGDRMLMPSYAVEPMTTTLTAADADATTITVENPRNVAVTIYIERGDFDTLVGKVAAGSTATLRLPPTAGQSIEVFVHPEGGIDLSSTPFTVTRGTHLGLRVPLR